MHSYWQLAAVLPASMCFKLSCLAAGSLAGIIATANAVPVVCRLFGKLSTAIDGNLNGLCTPACLVPATCLPAADICEGFDHPDAPPTDLDAAAQQLRIATMQEYQKRLAYKPSRKQSKKAAAVARQQQAGSSSSSSSSDAGSSSSTSSNSSSSCSSSRSSSSSSSRAVSAASSRSSSDSSWQEKLQKLQSIREVSGEEQL